MKVKCISYSRHWINTLVVFDADKLTIGDAFFHAYCPLKFTLAFTSSISSNLNTIAQKQVRAAVRQYRLQFLPEWQFQRYFLSELPLTLIENNLRTSEST